MRERAEATLLSHTKKSGLTLRAVGSQGTTCNSLSLPLPDLTDLVLASRGSQADTEEASAKCQDKGFMGGQRTGPHSGGGGQRRLPGGGNIGQGLGKIRTYSPGR